MWRRRRSMGINGNHEDLSPLECYHLCICIQQASIGWRHKLSGTASFITLSFEPNLPSYPATWLCLPPSPKSHRISPKHYPIWNKWSHLQCFQRIMWAHQLQLDALPMHHSQSMATTSTVVLAFSFLTMTHTTHRSCPHTQASMTHDLWKTYLVMIFESVEHRHTSLQSS